jgi:hypothetical protein
MGFYEDVTWYFWNWMVYAMTTEGSAACFSLGWYGTVFLNDDGAMINECLKWGAGGPKTEHPYVFE